MISRINRHNYSYYKNCGRCSYFLFEGNLRKFIQDYLSENPLQHGESFNIKMVLKNSGLTKTYQIEKILSNLFPDSQSLSPKIMQEILSLSHNVEEHQFLVQFLMGLCSIENQYIQKKYRPIFLKLEGEIKKVFPAFYYLKTTPTVSEMMSLFSEIDDCERELNSITHEISGVSDIDKESLLSLTKEGVPINYGSNVIGNQHFVIDKAEVPNLKTFLSLKETAAITDVEAFWCSTAGGFIMAYWRKINRARDLKDLKLYHCKRMAKLIEIYDHQPLALRPIPLTKEILKKARDYNPHFSRSRMRKILEKSQPPIPDPLPISNSVPLQILSAPVFKAPVPLVSSQLSLHSYQSPISSIPSSPDISSADESPYSSVQSLSPVHSQFSTPSLSPKHITEINKVSLIYPFKIDQIRALKNAIKKVKENSYSSSSVQIFVNEIEELKRNIPNFKDLMHDAIFKSTTDKWKFWKRSKLWEKNSTRGTFFGQLLQLNEKVSHSDELKSLIEFGFQCYPSQSVNIHSYIESLMDKNKKQLLKTNWKDRHTACRTIENIIVRVHESELASSEKQMILECQHEDIKDSTAQMTSSLEEKRNLDESEGPTIALGLQSYNVSRFIGADQFKNGAKVASDLTGTILPSFTFPMNSLMSKTNTTTKKSILSMLRGGIKYIHLINENKISNKTSPQKIVKRINSILNKNKNKKFIEGSDVVEINTILLLAKNQGYLHFLLEYFHGNKNYILFELMKKMPENNFNDLLRMAYPLKSLIDIKCDEDLLKYNSLRKFSNFMCDNLKLASKAKKETTFVAVKTMAYLVHLHDKINLLSKNSDERLHHEKIYQQCYVRFNEHIKNGIKYKKSAFRILTKTRSSSVNFFYKSIGKIIGRVFTSRISLLIQPFVFGAMGVLGAPFGLILVGFAITLSAYVFRLVISAVFDNPDFYHSANTLSYSSLINEIPKLPHFNGNKDAFSFLSTRDKMKEFNSSIKSYSSDEIKIQFERIIGSLHEEDQFIVKLNKEIKDLIIEDETKRAEIVFEKILEFSSLTKSTCIIDKSNLLDNLIRSVYLSLNCSLTKKEKKKLFALFEKEMADTKSNLGQLRRQNSYVRENKYFMYDALTSVYCIFGLVGSVVLTPVLSKVSVWLSSICNAVISSFGYPIKDFVQNYKDNNLKPYASTASSIEAKLFLKLTREFIKRKSRPKSGILIELNE